MISQRTHASPCGSMHRAGKARRGIYALGRHCEDWPGAFGNHWEIHLLVPRILSLSRQLSQLLCISHHSFPSDFPAHLCIPMRWYASHLEGVERNGCIGKALGRLAWSIGKPFGNKSASSRIFSPPRPLLKWLFISHPSLFNDLPTHKCIPMR